MIHACARCWIHEDCLVDLELAVACGPNPLDMQVLDGGWGEDDSGYGGGVGYGGVDGDGYGGGGGGFGYGCGVVIAGSGGGGGGGYVEGGQ